MTDPATFPGPWRALRRHLRPWVVKSADWPLVGDVQRGVYGVQRARVARALRRVAPQRTVLLRGSVRRAPRPGLSDLDLVVLLDEGSAAGERRAIRETLACVRRVNRLAPLVRDVTFLTRDDVAILSALDHQLLALVRADHEPLVEGDAEPWLGDGPPATEEASAIARRHHVGYWTHKGIAQLLREDAPVGPLLAARSFAKAAGYADPDARGPVIDVASSEPAGWQDAARALARLDRVLGAAPPHDSRETPAPVRGAIDLGPLAHLDATFAVDDEAGLWVALAPDALDAASWSALRAGPPARLITPRQLARRSMLPRRGWDALAPLAPTEALGPSEIAPGELAWVARWTLVEGMFALRERLAEPWSVRERRRHERFVLERVPRCWRLAGGQGEPPTGGVGEGASPDALHDAARSVIAASRGNIAPSA